MKSLRPASALGLLLFLLPATSHADEIRLRDGTTLTGSVLVARSDGYVFRGDHRTVPMQTIPRAAVRTVFYDDPIRADRELGIRSALRHIEGDSGRVRLLPTRPFGQAILEAVRSARKSIWVSAYYISGSRTPPIRDFYATLKEQAQKGLDVVIVSEYGHGTSARVREATFNFARELEQAGIRVLFIRERRILHKKMILVDDRIAFLGSSNLTMAGTLQSDEMNVEIRQPDFVTRVRRDFERLIARARTPESIQGEESP